MTKVEHDLGRELSARISDAIMEAEISPSFEIVMSAIANVLSTRFAVEPDLTEADIVEVMNDFRDHVVKIFQYHRENDVSDGELIRHDN
jgi:hypothetical protein